MRGTLEGLGTAQSHVVGDRLRAGVAGVMGVEGAGDIRVQVGVATMAQQGQVAVGPRLLTAPWRKVVHCTWSDPTVTGTRQPLGTSSYNCKGNITYNDDINS